MTRRPDHDLQRRLRLASAQLVIERVEPREAVLLACDLLAAGASGGATLELAIQSSSRLHQNDADELLRAMLADWQIASTDLERSAEIVAHDLCRRLLARSLRPEECGHRLLGALAQTGDRAVTDRLLALLDRLEFELGGRADDDLERELRALARIVLDNRERRC
ncbi:hypothetical protein BJY16_006425 [Actinoplanes octamycinicus]|uniref:Uncharacterized protein n=1 Tax=Actinoplanes octamycinicus TaxID=135948 RepID=A0A7W7MAI6_9ACTN|nr:hypothetical protein [Actinoplanes octamycinicus]MBB4742966.1 hypothetical protein [Actinoplanes octamycinicus]GIE58181.1 hypothetical protein Aoc01nite_35830 [Actinoplanes octamycinicus]